MARGHLFIFLANNSSLYPVTSYPEFCLFEIVQLTLSPSWTAPLFPKDILQTSPYFLHLFAGIVAKTGSRFVSVSFLLMQFMFSIPAVTFDVSSKCFVGLWNPLLLCKQRDKWGTENSQQLTEGHGVAPKCFKGKYSLMSLWMINQFIISVYTFSKLMVYELCLDYSN